MPKKKDTVITSVRLPVPLHRLITQAATAQAVSVNDWMLAALTDAVLRQPIEGIEQAADGVRYAATLRFTIASADPDADAYHVTDQAALTAELVGGSNLQTTVERLAAMGPRKDLLGIENSQT